MGSSGAAQLDQGARANEASAGFENPLYEAAVPVGSFDLVQTGASSPPVAFSGTVWLCVAHYSYYSCTQTVSGATSTVPAVRVRACVS